MGLVYKLQNRMLKKAIKKGKDNDYLADKFPMSMLVENKVFTCVNNTQFFKPVNTNSLYDIEGAFLGEIVTEDFSGEYIILKKESEFENADENISYAVFDRDAKCVVPHGCYATLFKTEDYAVLTMPMADSMGGMVKRITKESDDDTYMPATGKSLQETIYNLVYPKSLLVSKDKIVNTYYTSMTPVPIKEYKKEVLPYNAIWIAQTRYREVAVKYDKLLRGSETYSLPYCSYTQKDLFYANRDSNDVYRINIENDEPKRISLRTGKTVNLITMETKRLLKKDRVMSETPSESIQEKETPKEEVISFLSI